MNRPQAKKAFTLIELLVVIAIIAILASLLLPVLKSAKDKSIGARCMSSYRQLQFAWHMYSGDNRDWIAGNHWQDEKNHIQNENWLSGWMDPTAANNNDNFDTSLFMDPKYGSLGPYSVNPKIYLCAASRVTAKKGTSSYPVVRTVSMSVWMGYVTYFPGGSAFTTFRKTSQIGGKISPSSALVFADERDDSIDDGEFKINMTGNVIANIPAAFHNNSGGVTFADGHSELHRWQSLEIIGLRQVYGDEKQKAHDIPVAADNIDYMWLTNHATY